MSFAWNLCARTRNVPALTTLGLCATLAVTAAAAPALAARHKPAPGATPAAAAPGSPSAAEGSPTAAPATPLEPAGAPTMPTYSQKAHFSFVVLGDTAPPSTDLPVPTSLFLIYDDIQVVRPDMIFHTGNAIWAKPGDESGAQLQFYRFRLAVDTLPAIPYYIAPGSKDIPDEEADVVFRRNISGGQPWRSFDYGNSHFIVLDSEVPNEQGKIAGQQLAFLQTDLDAHSQAAHTFVFVNRTPFPAAADAPADGVFATPADRDSFTALMSRYHVNTVFSGGQSVYSVSTHDGVRYVNTGGGGSATSASPADGGFFHYVIVQVDGDNVTAVPVEPRRVSVRTDLVAPNTTTVYNTSATPLILNNVPVNVPSSWRSKHQGLLGDQKLALYQVSAATAPGSTPQTIEVAPVDITDAAPNSPFQIDFLHVRVEVPAGAAITIRVVPAP